MWKKFSSYAKWLLVILMLMGALSKNASAEMPVEIELTGGTFTLSPETTIYVDSESAEMLQIGQYLADKLNLATGYSLTVIGINEIPTKGIYLTITEGDSALGEEGYQLTITPDLVKLEAHQPAGIFYALQTFTGCRPSGNFCPLPSKNQPYNPKYGRYPLARLPIIPVLCGAEQC
jgi:N-acetyl-beta-hexosaminidase